MKCKPIEGLKTVDDIINPFSNQFNPAVETFKNQPCAPVPAPIVNPLTETAETVLKRRYYLKDGNDEPRENWQQLCDRVSHAVAGGDLGRRVKFFDLLHGRDFLPNSPCLMNAGTDIGQLSACFVLPVEDSMDDIFTAIRNGALVHKTGGGTGYSFSRLRQADSPVQSTQGVASGPLSFMRVFDAATETIKQGGKRRGANMGVLRIDHPDIVDFIRAKEVDGVLSNFNLSVAITDEFMKAVKDGGEYPLIDPHDGTTVDFLDAGKVFDEIVRKAWSNGEPGVLFIDAANKANPTPELGKFEVTNPCGEQFLLPYESCNLGSINLDRYVSYGEVDWKRLEGTIITAVQFLNGVIDVNKYPLPEIKAATEKTRKIGLGIMGLHDMLIQLELRYDSKRGRSIAERVMRFIHEVAKRNSIVLSEETGLIRNAALTSIQPTGTVSMIADCSSGCEPYFAIVTEKTVMDGEKFLMVNKHFERVARKEGFYSESLMEKIKETGTVAGQSEVPEKWQRIFRTSQDISPEDHILMQASLQNNGVDSSISKTINMPENATPDDVRNAYMQAWELGCKGLTIYRDGSRAEQVLTAGKKVAKEMPNNHMEFEGLRKKELPDVLDAKRYRLKGEDGESVYIIICFDDQKIPVEVFAKFPYENLPERREITTMWATTCRMVSLSLRYGAPVEEIIKQLDRSSGSMFDLPAQLGKLLKSFLVGTGQGYISTCPECGSGLVFEEGCEICKSCGYSKCS